MDDREVERQLRDFGAEIVCVGAVTDLLKAAINVCRIGKKITGEGLIAITNWHLLVDKEELESIERFFSRLEEDKLLSVYLYGSSLEKLSENSDIDLFIEPKGNGKDEGAGAE